MSPHDKPLGPRAVVITNNTISGTILKCGSYFSTTISRRGFVDLQHRKLLPATVKLGVPISFVKQHDLYGPNHIILDLLSLDCDSDSDVFGEPLYNSVDPIVCAREDGKDLWPKQMQAIVSFLESELRPLMKYGLQDNYSSMEVAEEIESDGNETNKTKDSDDDSNVGGTGEDEGNSGEPSEIEDRDNESSSGVDIEDRYGGDQITKLQAEAAVANITPGNFAAYFERYRAEQAEGDKIWHIVESPLQTIPVCKQCGGGGGKDGERLLLCGACGSVRYCGEECQKAHWTCHKETCKAVKKVVKRVKARFNGLETMRDANQYAVA